MLLKPSPPITHCYHSKFSFNPIFTSIPNSTCSNCKFNGKLSKKTVGVAVINSAASDSDGYRKRALETPGAYELIDNKTGEKYIVWGDDDDGQTLIPSKQVLQWEPPPSTNFDTDKPRANTMRVSQSFQRLRAGRVRNLGRISSEKDLKDGDSRNGPIVLVKDRSNVRKDEPIVPRSEAEKVNGSITKSRARDAGGISMNVATKLRKSDIGGDFFSRKSFKDVGCTDYMLHFLDSQLLAYPSHIQAMAFPHVVQGRSCIIADQSGSGKTLAYLLPVIQSIRQDELQGLAKSLPKSPRVVILVPTAELASQVLRNCRLMSKSGVPFRSMIATGGFKQKTQLENLRNELDVLIATPGRFLYLVQEGYLELTSLKCAVLDEVDILFKDEDFQPALQSLMNLSPITTQYLFVTATLPVEIYNKLIENFPDCEVIMGPGMHRTSSGLEEILVDCSGEDGIEKTPDTAFLNKKSALLKLVEEGPPTKMIIFCNKIETCRKVENALTRFNKKVLPFHAALAQDLRVANMEEFCQTRLRDSSLFLVCTDRASRGIDIPGVDQVVLFDFPRDPSEYVRRVGRTARGAGGKGRAFIFVVGKQVSLARRIVERNRKGHPLHDVPSNI
uniref:DEAD-box ATP-dependent RNA helicase 50 n=1 Tax=Erigeron canadensis TaxID=72917 RepID=UPI001CB95AA2|nr:DEAD-box ATP-dependent RNA helicase 50 [Erigeron canadensis]